MALQFHPLTVAAVIDETPDSRSFVFAVPAALRATFAYRAGQFLTFEVPWQGFAIRRCYSLSSAPEVDAAPRITVKRIAGGRMSSWLIENVKVGDVLSVSPPDGRFVLDAAAGARPLALWGAGSGITPLISILKHALARTERRIKLVYANRERGSVILARELEQLAHAHPERVDIHLHLDDQAGLLGVAELRRLLRGHEDGDHYVCGPAPFMDAVTQVLEAAGVRGERRHFERFISALDPDRRAALVRPRHHNQNAPASFVVRLAGEVHQVAYQAGMTLLAAAHRSGVKAPSSCEDGYCGSCVAHLVEGDVAMRSCKALGPTEIAARRILLCQSVATSAAPLAVECDPAPLSLASPLRARPPQPLMPRVLASLLVAAVFLLFFLFRSRP